MGYDVPKMPTFAEVSGNRQARKKPSPKDLEIDSVRVERADNGFTVNVHRKVKSGLAGKFESLGYMEPERSVFETTEAMLDHVGSLFG